MKKGVTIRKIIFCRITKCPSKDAFKNKPQVAKIVLAKSLGVNIIERRPNPSVHHHTVVNVCHTQQSH